MVATCRTSRTAQNAPPAKKLKSNVEGISNTDEADVEANKASTSSPSQKPESTRRVTRKRKAKEKIDPSTFLKRVNSPWLVGAHVSAAKGVENAVTNAASIGANSFALFLKSQRKWTSPDLTEASILEFKKRMDEHGYSSKMILPHGSYLINLGNPDAEKCQKSYVCFLDDLKRCEALGLKLYNFHPGSTVGQATTEESLTLIADCINRAHKETHSVITVLENMAGAGNIIGSQFAHLAGIIKQVEDKSRVGVCIDTCHAFAAVCRGLSIDREKVLKFVGETGVRYKNKSGLDVLKQFDEIIGLKYFAAMHLNDSKTDYNSKKDRHENIGLGHLGINAFHHILTDPRTQGIPLILETPSFEQPKEVWGREIEILQHVSSVGNASRSEASENVDNQPDPDFADLASQIKVAVKEAEKLNGGPKNKGKKPVKAKKAGAKRKRKDSEHEESDSEDAEESDAQ